MFTSSALIKTRMGSLLLLATTTSMFFQTLLFQPTLATDEAQPLLLRRGGPTTSDEEVPVVTPTTERSSDRAVDGSAQDLPRSDGGGRSAPREDAVVLRVMTYNVNHKSIAGDTEHYMNHRASILDKIRKRMLQGFHVIALQEGVTPDVFQQMIGEALQEERAAQLDR